MRVPLSTLFAGALSFPLALAAPSPAPPPCSIDLPSTHEHVSLSNLKRPSGSDYVTKDSATGDTIYLNVCRSVLKETWGAGDASKVGVYRERERQKGESLGSWNETLMVQEGEVGMVMGDGSPCPGNSRRMSTLISFQCAHDVWGPGEPHFAGTPDGCAFFFTWRTPHACPTSGRRGFWHSLSAVFWGAVVVLSFYILLFFSYNRFVKGRRGAEQFPPLRPSGAIWERVRDGFTLGVIWVMDRFSDFGRVLMGRDRGGNAGWTPASGREWWEQHQGYHRQNARRSTDAPGSRRSTTSGAGAFALGDDDDQREEARAGRVAKFGAAGNGDAKAAPSVNVVPPTPTGAQGGEAQPPRGPSPVAGNDAPPSLVDT